MTETYLIGTSHMDINGPKRLETKLYEIKPKIVLVEGDISLETQKEQYLIFSEKELKNQHVNPKFIEVILNHQNSLITEHTVAKDYALSNEAKLVLKIQYKKHING